MRASLPGPADTTPRQPARRLTLAVAALALGLLVVAGGTMAQPVEKRIADGPSWGSLNAAQKKALKPLERDWNSIDGPRKTKWLDIAGKYEKLSPAEQERVQDRMSDWTRLSPKERGEVRQNYKEAQQVPDRKARWESYNALSPEERQKLADRAKPQPQAKRRDDGPNRKKDEVAPKSNIVPNSSYAARPRTVAPAVSQAQPGATTNLISKRATPPAHQQPGLPKIAATPNFVDQTTLLPKRGAQSAGTRSAAALSEQPNSRP
jgi:hypothetical protein